MTTFDPLQSVHITYNMIICFTFPPFVCAQIRNCTAQGKVTQQKKMSKRDTQHTKKSSFYDWTSTFTINYGKIDRIYNDDYTIQVPEDVNQNSDRFRLKKM